MLNLVRKWAGMLNLIHASNKLSVPLLFHQAAKWVSVHILIALASTPRCARNNLAGLKRAIRVHKKSSVLLSSQPIAKAAKDLAPIVFVLIRKHVSRNSNGIKMITLVHLFRSTLLNPLHHATRQLIAHSALRWIKSA